ncbi:unnamed protein product [Allacma fusca]|uniref:Uncharacterized protein n=1 Tax=Allacma fusca TaxID=39272 RepID=A0A8J2KQ14_9HEXA|nr:unnamed protein product [Allacma fusca]
MEGKHTRLLIGLDYFIWIFGYAIYIAMMFSLYFFAKGILLMQTEGPKAQVSQIIPAITNKAVSKVADW